MVTNFLSMFSIKEGNELVKLERTDVPEAMGICLIDFNIGHLINMYAPPLFSGVCFAELGPFGRGAGNA